MDENNLPKSVRGELVEPQSFDELKANGFTNQDVICSHILIAASAAKLKIGYQSHPF